MFTLTLLDHLQLTFKGILDRHRTHAQAAASQARRNRWLQGGEALLVGGVTIAAGGAAFGHSRALTVTAAVLSGAALIVLLVRLAFASDSSAQAHASCSTSLWHLAERYRALLSDIHEGAVDASAARQRRDRLIDEFKAIYAHTPAIEPMDILVDADAATTDAVTINSRA